MRFRFTLTDDDKKYIENKNPDFIDVLYQYFISDGTEVKAEVTFEEGTEIVYGKILVAGEDPINEPLFWLKIKEEEYDGKSKINYVPLYECNWIEAL